MPLLFHPPSQSQIKIHPDHQAFRGSGVQGKIQRAAEVPGIQMIRIEPEIAWESCHLPGNFHRDPADQIIAATARILDLTLITRDRRLLHYSGIRSIW